MCVLDSDFVLEAEHPEMLSLLLIGVSTRALLHNCPNETADEHARIEQACMKAQRVFVKRIPRLRVLYDEWEREAASTSATWTS
jgi:hypothetical protein